MRQDEEVERAVIAAHAEERLALESASLLKYKKWMKGAMIKFNEQKKLVRTSRWFVSLVACVVIQAIFLNEKSVAAALGAAEMALADSRRQRCTLAAAPTQTRLARRVS